MVDFIYVNRYNNDSLLAYPFTISTNIMYTNYGILIFSTYLYTHHINKYIYNYNVYIYIIGMYNIFIVFTKKNRKNRTYIYKKSYTIKIFYKYNTK